MSNVVEVWLKNKSVDAVAPSSLIVVDVSIETLKLALNDVLKSSKQRPASSFQSHDSENPSQLSKDLSAELAAIAAVDNMITLIKEWRPNQESFGRAGVCADMAKVLTARAQEVSPLVAKLLEGVADLCRCGSESCALYATNVSLFIQAGLDNALPVLLVSLERVAQSQVDCSASVIPETMLQILRCVRNLATDPATNERLGAHGTCAVIVRLVRRGLDVWGSTAVVEQGCLVFANLACAGANRLLLQEADCCALIVECLERYPASKHEQVASSALMAVGNLCFDSVCRDAFFVVNCCPVVFATLQSAMKPTSFSSSSSQRAPSRSPVLLDLCCKALANLVASDAFDNRRVCGELGLCTVIVSVITEFGKVNVRVAESACRVVKNLCCNIVVNQTLLASAGIGPALLGVISSALSQHPGVAENACRALANLASHDNTRENLGDCGCCEGMVDLLRYYLKTPYTSVIFHTVWAIDMLAWGSPRNLTLLVVAGVVPLLQGIVGAPIGAYSQETVERAATALIQFTATASAAESLATACVGANTFEVPHETPMMVNHNLVTEMDMAMYP